ncbi:MAG: sulfite exporter TauE/SafE family protein [Candidatus Korobacteraceae bacterium]
MIFDVLLFLAACLAGGVAAISGFGIGSLLTPLLALAVDTRVAVAAVSIPHFVGTLLRFLLLRRHVDRRLLWNFGLTSAVGGLLGALLHTSISSLALTLIFGVLLVFAGITGISGVAQRMQFHGSIGWIAGLLSGVLGGLVGNQGGIRSAALLGFHVPKHAFVATATAIALFVDIARMPVYFAYQSGEIAGLIRPIALATTGVALGTLVGSRLLRLLPESLFRRIVAIIILVLGFYMLYAAFFGQQ